MSNIARFDPVREVTTFNSSDDPFEDFFRGFFLRPIGWEPRALEGQAGFRADVSENDKEYRVQAEIPGVRKEDINITVNGNEVAISAESKREEDVKDKDGTVLRSEREYGKMYRAFTLGDEIDEARVQAKYNDGILELTLPKSAVAASKKKRIAIH